MLIVAGAFGHPRLWEKMLGGVTYDLLTRMSLVRALFFFGVLQAVSNLSFAWLALAGKSYPLLVFTIGLPEGLFAFAARKWSQFERVVPVEEGEPRGP